MGVSRFGLSVRRSAGKLTTSVRFDSASAFSSKSVVYRHCLSIFPSRLMTLSCDFALYDQWHRLVTLPFMINNTVLGLCPL